MEMWMGKRIFLGGGNTYSLFLIHDGKGLRYFGEV